MKRWIVLVLTVLVVSGVSMAQSKISVGGRMQTTELVWERMK